MERKIGEIFEFGGEWYQCLKSASCDECAFSNSNCIDNPSFKCSVDDRTDNCSVIFKKLEKVGEPLKIHNRLVLKVKADAYKCMRCCFYSKGKCELTIQECEHYDCGKDTKFIEIKQTKEDMEEKKQKLDDLVGLYTSAKITYKEFDEKLKTLYADKEECKSSLKEFDLEAAKAGKPVCTRDGRKARIVCFDAEGNKPLIVLSKINGQEVILRYTEKGRSDNFHSPTPREDDLMMLPEKKEGWINIYNADTTFYYVDGRVFETKDEAVQEAKEEVEEEQREKNEYIDTIRVEWEE